MQEIEKILFKNCHNRTIPTEIDMQEAFEIEEEIPAYFASGEFDAARITKDNAISLLHSYVFVYASFIYVSGILYSESCILIL